MELLLAKGAKADQAVGDGATPLIGSSERGHPEVVKLLLDNGAKIDQADNDGDTPLSISRRNGHREVEELLLASIAKLSQAEQAAKAEAVKEEEGRVKRAARVCQLCGKEAQRMKKCSVCKLVRYCGEECQLGDWKKHKKSCKEAGGAEEGGRERELVGENQREEEIGCHPFEPSEREVRRGRRPV